MERMNEPYDRPALVKSKKFALRTIRLYQHLRDNRHEFVMSKQILRSGTSIGANLSEAQYAISRNDFLSKIYISLKECAETAYWLELLLEADYITKAEYQSLAADCEEIRKMLSATTATIRKE